MSPLAPLRAVLGRRAWTYVLDCGHFVHGELSVERGEELRCNACARAADAALTDHAIEWGEWS